MKTIILVFLSIILTSCASSSSIQDESYKILQNFAFEASQHVEFDPYSAKVFFERNKIQALLNQTQVKLQQNGCGELLPIDMNFPSVEDFYDVFVRNYGIQDDAWKMDLYRQLTQNKQGWAIAQVEFPKSGMMHGDYSVKGILMFYISWCGGNGRGGDYGFTPAFYIDIKSKAKENTTVQQPKTSEGSLEKLKKLKEMLDAGLINQQDYDAKKKIILEGI